MIDWQQYFRWRPAFAQAMDRQFHTPEWLDARMLAGTTRLWTAEGAAAVTEVRTFPTGAYDVHGLVAAGDLPTLRDRVIPQIEAWGHQIGAASITIESRAGWAKLLRSNGYAPHQITVRKKLSQ